MCNAYNLGRRRRESPTSLPSGLLELLVEDRLIRRTDHAPVVTGERTLATMRWGFERPSLGTINNSREDKLAGRMWSRAFRERRCLIPAASFYEWSGPKGQKRTHLFTRPDGDWFWIAGIWEESSQFGLCYSMITTVANATMAPIHDRMPAYLERDEIDPYLDGALDRFAPQPKQIAFADAPNPLVKSRPKSVQGELF